MNTEPKKDMNTEHWIQAKQQEFEQKLQDLQKNERRKFKIDILFSMEISLAIVIICASIAAIVVRFITPDTVTITEITYSRGIGYINVSLLVLIGLSRLWRKRLTQKQP